MQAPSVLLLVFGEAVYCLERPILCLAMRQSKNLDVQSHLFSARGRHRCVEKRIMQSSRRRAPLGGQAKAIPGPTKTFDRCQKWPFISLWDTFPTSCFSIPLNIHLTSLSAFPPASTTATRRIYNHESKHHFTRPAQRICGSHGLCAKHARLSRSR